MSLLEDEREREGEIERGRRGRRERNRERRERKRVERGGERESERVKDHALPNSLNCFLSLGSFPATFQIYAAHQPENFAPALSSAQMLFLKKFSSSLSPVHISTVHISEQNIKLYIIPI